MKKQEQTGNMFTVRGPKVRLSSKLDQRQFEAGKEEEEEEEGEREREEMRQVGPREEESLSRSDSGKQMCCFFLRTNFSALPEQENNKFTCHLNSLKQHYSTITSMSTRSKPTSHPFSFSSTCRASNFRKLPQAKIYAALLSATLISLALLAPSKPVFAAAAAAAAAAGQKQQEHNNQYMKDLSQQERASNYLNQASVQALETATTSVSRGQQNPQEVSKSSEQQQQQQLSLMKSNNKQPTTYLDVDSHLDSIHSPSTTINLSRRQPVAPDNSRSSTSARRRVKRNSYQAQRALEAELELELELELERRKNVDLKHNSGVELISRYRRLSARPDVPGNDSNGSQEASCHKLLLFWASFKQSYPYLATHLLNIFPAAGEAPQAEQSFKVAQLIKSMAKLLNEAELLAKASSTSNNNNGAKTNPWLVRVLANPVYAKIVQQHFPAAAAAKLQQSQQRNRQLDIEQESSSSSLSSSSLLSSHRPDWNNTNYVYGRVIHYPHELSNADASTARTLQKLRQLDSQRKMSELEVDTSKEPDRELESNRIQSVFKSGIGGGDGEPWLRDSHTKNYDSDLEAARNKFVYGSVFLKPSQKQQNDGNNQAGEHSQRHTSMETLRKLQFGTNNDHQELAQRQRQLDQNNESYGRVLVSPASFSRLQHDTNDNQQHKHNNHNQQQDQDRWLGRGSTLDKLKQRLEPTNQFASGGFDSSTGNNKDELNEQQHGNSMAVQSTPDLTANSDSSNEFEGDWHSGPLQQVEVRQPRADSLTGQIIRTTANPRDAFLVE